MPVLFNSRVDCESVNYLVESASRRLAELWIIVEQVAVSSSTLVDVVGDAVEPVALVHSVTNRVTLTWTDSIGMN